jgi:hypothetical protein
VSYVDALLPDLGTTSIALSLLLRPEIPPLLGRPIRLCANADAGIFDVGLTVILECSPGNCGRALLLSKLNLGLAKDAPEGNVAGGGIVIGPSPSERGNPAAALAPSEERFV